MAIIGGRSLRIEAASVVLEDDEKERWLFADGEIERTCVGMFEDIVEAFLNHSEDLSLIGG